MGQSGFADGASVPPSSSTASASVRARASGTSSGASGTPSTSMPPSKVRRVRLTKVRRATWCATEVAASGPTRIEAPKPRRMSMASSCVAARPLSMKYLAVRCSRVWSISAFIGSAPESGVDVFAAMPVAAVRPAVLALIFEDAKIFVADRRRGEVGHDDGDVPRARDHRIGAVGSALKGGAGMRVDVGDDAKLPRAAHRPKLSESIGFENAHAARVGLRIEIVVVDDIDGGAPAVMVMAEQKRAGFMPGFRAPVQLRHGARPQGGRAVQAVLRRRERPNNRLD